MGDAEKLARPSCEIHTHTPARKSYSNFQLCYFVVQSCSTDCLGHGHGYECRSSSPASRLGRDERSSHGRATNPLRRATVCFEVRARCHLLSQVVILCPCFPAKADWAELLHFCDDRVCPDPRYACVHIFVFVYVVYVLFLLRLSSCQAAKRRRGGRGGARGHGARLRQIYIYIYIYIYIIIIIIIFITIIIIIT